MTSFRSAALALLGGLTIVAALGACVSPVATPTPLFPSPTATPATPTPSPQATPWVPPTGAPGVNLSPHAPAGWARPLIISDRQKDLTGASWLASSDVYVSWAVSNRGPEAVSRRFFVDVYLDDVLVERWTAEGAGVGGYRFVQDWEGLLSRVPLTPGLHRLTLVVDPTGLVEESDESDNTFTTEFTWAGSSAPPAEDGRYRALLPNLVPFTPPGWDAPIQLYSKENGQPVGRLSTDTTTYVRVAYKNAGLSSIGTPFSVYLYLDGVVVARYRERELISDSAVATPEWDGLASTIRLTPGPHTLRLVVDPTGLVAEANEADNTYVKVFHWDGSQAPAQPTPTPAPGEGRPRLQLVAPPGWDAPLVAAMEPGLFANQSGLIWGRTAYLHWAISNTGDADLNIPFYVEARLDGRGLASWYVPGLKAGASYTTVAWPLEVLPGTTEGEHTLELRLDISRQLPRAWLASQAFTRQVRWSGSTPPATSPLRYTLTEIRERLALLDRLLITQEIPLTDWAPYTRDILEVADAIYFSIYDKSLRDEKVSILILGNADYARWVQVYCHDVTRQFPQGQPPTYGTDCLRLESFAAFTTFWKGRHHIVLRGQRPPAQVLIALAHELGHFRQGMENQALDTAAATSFNVSALREAQAYAHEALMLRTLEALTGRALLLYPDLDRYNEYVDTRLAEVVAGVNASEHDRGRLLAWLAILTDPKVRRLRTELLIEGKLSASSYTELFRYLVGIRASDANKFVDSLLRGLTTQAPAIADLAKARLIRDLAYWAEGSPYMRDTGLLLP